MVIGTSVPECVYVLHTCKCVTYLSGMYVRHCMCVCVYVCEMWFSLNKTLQ